MFADLTHSKGFHSVTPPPGLSYSRYISDTIHVVCFTVHPRPSAQYRHWNADATHDLGIRTVSLWVLSSQVMNPVQIMCTCKLFIFSVSIHTARINRCRLLADGMDKAHHLWILILDLINRRKSTRRQSEPIYYPGYSSCRKGAERN